MKLRPPRTCARIVSTVGLLHSVGMLAIDEWILRKRPGHRLVSQGLPREACESERALLGFTQAETGAALLRHWDFPQSMSEPVRWQYFPRSTAGHQRMACLLHAAKWVRSAACAPDLFSLPPAPDPWVLQPLRLDPSRLDRCVVAVQERLVSISSLLEAAPKAVQAVEFPGGTRQFDPAAVRPAT